MSQETYKSYIAGFIASIVLTLAAYFAVVHPSYFRLAPAGAGGGSGALLTIMLALAFVQLAVQLFLFLHLGAGSGSRLKLIAFGVTFAFVLLIVLASLWIMNHLNYNMMASPQEMQQYINDQQGF